MIDGAAWRRFRRSASMFGVYFGYLDEQMYIKIAGDALNGHNNG